MQMVTFSAVSGPAPTVSSVSPEQRVDGGRHGGDDHRDELRGGATVTFGSAAATNVTVVNSTTITATTPAGSAGAVNRDGDQHRWAEREPGQCIYLYGAPTVSGRQPNSGPAAGGTAVTITGTNFAAGATVTFGGTAATNVTVVNSTTITATTPAGSAGAVTVTVTSAMVRREAWRADSRTLWRRR